MTDDTDALRRIRKQVTETELLRVIRPILHRLGEPGYRVPITIQRALKRWAEATYIVRPSMTPRVDPTPPTTDTNDTEKSDA